MTDQLDRLTTALGDRYRVERAIGRGGMATVYLAEDLKHERRVALKVLKPELAAVLGADRFLREIRIAANLQHPHILPLYDSGSAGELLYYVMPYVSGDSLRQRLNRQGALDLETALALTRQVADALSYAHRQGVVHRDIKPENVLFDADGTALLCDFGMARALVRASSDQLRTSKLLLGTPEYISPERAAGREVDHRSDIYGLGCVVYEMLAGEPPFTGRSARVVLARHLKERPPSLRVVRPDLPQSVEDAVLRALAKKPEKRWASGGELCQHLAHT